MLQIHKLPEEVSFVHEAAWPLQIEYSYTLTNGKITTICEQQGGVLITD